MVFANTFSNIISLYCLVITLYSFTEKKSRVIEVKHESNRIFSRVSLENCSAIKNNFVNAAAIIHKSADPNSVWSLLGESITSKKLYLPALQSESTILYQAKIGRECVAFVIAVKTNEFIKNKKSYKLTCRERVHIVRRITSSPKLLLRSFFIWNFEFSSKRLDSNTTMEIHSLMVMQDWQSLGIGSALLKAVKKEVFAINSDLDSLKVITFGKRSKKFYLREGFKNIKSWNFFDLSISLLRAPLPK